MATNSRRRTWGSFGVFNACVGACFQLLEEKGALQSHALDRATRPLDAGGEEVIGAFDLDDALLDLFAFFAVGFFDGGWQLWLLLVLMGERGFGCMGF